MDSSTANNVGKKQKQQIPRKDWKHQKQDVEKLIDEERAVCLLKSVTLHLSKSKKLNLAVHKFSFIAKKLTPGSLRA